VAIAGPSYKEEDSLDFIRMDAIIRRNSDASMGELVKVRKIFEKARQVSPSIIFFDEIDSLAPSRKHSADAGVSERVVNQILTEMSGVKELNEVVVIAATNRPDLNCPFKTRKV